MLSKIIAMSGGLGCVLADAALRHSARITPVWSVKKYRWPVTLGAPDGSNCVRPCGVYQPQHR